MQKNNERNQVTEGDSLQHAEKPEMRQIEKRERHLEKSERENNSGAAQDFQINVAFDFAFGGAATKRERNGNSDDKNKKRENQIRRSPAVPRGVFEWGVNRALVAGIIDQNHSGDGYSAKNIE